MSPLRPVYGRLPAAAALSAGLLLVLHAAPLRAQQQFDGFCATVKIEILQEMTLERIGFLATLEVTNNDAVDTLTGFTAALRFTRPQPGGSEVDATGLFWVRQPELLNVNGVDGDGNIAPGAKATVRWFIVPKTGAGGESPEGIRYYVHCDLAGSLRGEVLPREVMFAIPDMIRVQPEPELEITYFQPRDVQGDNPFTPQVEPPVPFTLGVRVRNVGYGPARGVVIRSEQPRIIENTQHLLLLAQLIGSRVMDQPLDRTSLTVNIGDLAPGQSRVAAWDMICSLSGTFTDFRATYTHAPEFGGEETSLIRSMDAHFFVREVLNDTVGRDNVRDFLVDTERTPDLWPDMLFESDGYDLPVNSFSEAVLTPAGPRTYSLTASALAGGANYLRLADPGQNRWRIERVERADGTLLNPHNAWTSTRYLQQGNTRLDELHLFDLTAAGAVSYTVVYAQDGLDTTPPETTIRFAGAHVEREGVHHIAPATQIFFESEDESPVSIWYRPTPEAEWLPAYPFTLAAGTHTIGYRAIDEALNEEEPRSAEIVVLDPGDATAGLTLAADRERFSLLADLTSARAGEVRLSLSSDGDTLPRDAVLDVFRGVRAWPRLVGVPASPMRPGTVGIDVTGEAVDVYRWRLNGGAWSADTPAATPLSLDCSAPGAYALEVLARSQHGVLPPEGEALTADWTVAADAPAATVSSAAGTPTPHRRPVFEVGGDGVTTYRWSLDGNYIRPSRPVSEPFEVGDLADGPHEVRVFPNLADGVHVEDGYVAYRWQQSALYGHACTGLPQVVAGEPETLTDGAAEAVWDGRNDAGVQVLPGWYTVRMTASNALGQTRWSKAYVEVEAIGAQDREVAGVERGVQRMHGRGDWVVWTDRSGPQWQIWARDLAGDAPAFAVTSAATTQDAPFTDGRYVVWQGRQADGAWGVYWADLEAPGTAVQVLSAQPGVDETSPSIDWPWTVWQAQDTAVPGAPRQLMARNLATDLQRAVSPSTQDQLAPHVQADRVVWQDWRDVGPGEIYFQDLESGEERRITHSPAGQLRPTLSGPTIVWQDNRHGQLDLYAHDLRYGQEIRLTDTPYDESSPRVEGDWVLYLENSLAPAQRNLRLLHLGSLRSAPLTRSESAKSFPTLLARHTAWVDTTAAGSRVIAGALPSLRGVYTEGNAVPVTAQMLATSAGAFQLLDRWAAGGRVVEISTYEQLWPTPVERRAWRDEQGQLQGDDFPLDAGMFLWLGFEARQLVDFGPAEDGPVTLTEGVGVLRHSGFPVGYSAFRLVDQLGAGAVRSLRMHDPETGRWQTLHVENGRRIGTDFAIPRIAVILVDMRQDVADWRPE